jgi:hypothetical protein
VDHAAAAAHAKAERAKAHRAAARRARARRAAARRRAVLRADSRRAADERARAVSPNDPITIARFTDLVHSSPGNNDNSGALLLAACALLALLFASGSFVSVASRLWRGQLR